MVTPWLSATYGGSAAARLDNFMPPYRVGGLDGRSIGNGVGKRYAELDQVYSMVRMPVVAIALSAASHQSLLSPSPTGY